MNTTPVVRLRPSGVLLLRALPIGLLLSFARLPAAENSGGTVNGFLAAAKTGNLEPVKELLAAQPDRIKKTR